MMKRDVPAFLDGIGPLKSYWDACGTTSRGVPDKVMPSLEDAIRASGLKNGMRVSFHHHLREGDGVINLVLRTIAEMGYKDIKIAPTSINEVNDELAPLARAGVITGVNTSGMRGEMGRMCSYGQLDFPVMFRSHGGRARAIDEGSLEIDVAFIASPSCDRFGNITGAHGPSACGGVGYATPDAAHAHCVVAVTDNLVEEPLADFSIPGSLVNFIAQVPSIGDPTKISAGATRLTRNPIDLVVAEKAAQVIRASSLYKPGFNIQFGAGGASLAIVRFLTDYMKQDDVKSSFVLGGMTSQCVEWLENGLTSALFDMQCFDLTAVRSLAKDARHTEIGTSQYASPAVAGAMVDYLDIVILAAMEVDLDFNVNVLTGSDGVVRGAPGGHPDSSQGAKLSMIVAPATRARLPLVLDKVGTVVTPGKDIACVVTDLGVAWNPLYSDLAPKNVPGLEIMDIKELKARIERLTGVPRPVEPSGKVVAVVECRDGTIMDVLRAIV